jgi:nucleoid DNA-binding protein
MNRRKLATRLARQTGISKAEAADQLDEFVHDVLTRLRKGRATPLPGLGTFVPGDKPQFKFEPGQAPGSRGPRGKRK